MKMKSNSRLDVSAKVENEKKITKYMIVKYCKGNGHGGSPCEECREIIDYSLNKIERCPFMEMKTYCSNCRVHCYKGGMREKIQEIMRYSGKRMLFAHPILAIDHMYQVIKHKYEQKKVKGVKVAHDKQKIN